MTKKEIQQQEEIERLQKKVKSLSEAYERTVRELEAVKKEKALPGKKGRPPVEQGKKLKVLSLYQKGSSMRAIAEQEGIAASTVHKIISEASKKSRILYVYADKELPATIIDACVLTRKVKIINLTDDMLSRAFGVNEKPNWEDYENFLESRCMPRTRFGIREELRYMGIDSYDPFLIIGETAGRVYGDHQYLTRMEKGWIDQYDKIVKATRDKSERKEKLQAFMRESEKEWKLDEGQY